MFLLDTNILSELRRPDKANARVLQWSNQVAMSEMYISVISILERELGILRIQRRDAVQATLLLNWLEHQVLMQFQGRILSIDIDVARCCAKLHVPNPKAERDALIAATALTHNLTVATRNIKDFEGCSVALLNPFESV